jgi:cell division protein FtsI (penicillin-binding protein 3)
MENVRITAPDLERRTVLRTTRRRLCLATFGFMLMFGSVAAKLMVVTVVNPRLPHQEAAAAARGDGQRDARADTKPDATADAKSDSKPSPLAAPAVTLAHRSSVVDRNGQPLAISVPSVSLFADPRQIIDAVEAAHRLKHVLPRMDEAAVRRRLANTSLGFAYIERQITPREQDAVNRLGIPGVNFRATEGRRYPMGPIVAQVLGRVDVDGRGNAGIEESFNQRLSTDPADLRLSLDLRVQTVVREELAAAMAEFQAIGACGIVMDVNTGEVLAMVSLPDYDPNDFKASTPDAQLNRAIGARYEPGSTFKLQTASMALDGGIVHIWDSFDASQPIHIGKFTITDFEGKHRWLALPEVLAFSSNLGAAHIAMAVGAERQRAWLKAMGMFDRSPIELPGAIAPQYPPSANWHESAVMTIGFGHGIAIEPLQVVRGVAAVANGGVLVRPTILALPPDAQPGGLAPGMAPGAVRVMQPATSDVMRKLMRLVVTAGYGKAAEVPGYYVGGKTGTAEKVGAHGYSRHANVSAFISVFPMNAPRYAVYMMLDEPHGNKATAGYATAGWVSAPAAGKVIARIGPMLGLLPNLQEAAAINQSLSIPLQPARPGAPEAAPREVPAEPAIAGAEPAGQPTVKATPAGPARVPPPSAKPPVTSPRTDSRHEAALVPPTARLLQVSVAVPASAAR